MRLCFVRRSPAASSPGRSWAPRSGNACCHGANETCAGRRWSAAWFIHKQHSIAKTSSEPHVKIKA
eukprot:scaffold21193_cov45-Prasinocladus_malaysianus.AAC.2